MVKKTRQRVVHHRKKALGVRRRLRSFAGRPRLCVNRSLNNISCQIIDDQVGRTLVAASSLEKDLRSTAGLKKTEMAQKVGTLIAQRAVEAGVKQVAFDRGRFKYHGRVKALADAARQGGLEF